jgi:hypothetical protein
MGDAGPAPEPEAPAPDSSDDGYNPFNISDTASDDSNASDVSNQMQCPRCGVTDSSDNFEYVPYHIDHPNAVAPNDCLENDRDFCPHCALVVLNTPGETGNYCEDNPDCVDCAADRAEQEQVPVPAPDAGAALEAGNQEPTPGAHDTPCPRCGTFQDFRGGYQCDDCGLVPFPNDALHIPASVPDAEAALEAGEQNDSECGRCLYSVDSLDMRRWEFPSKVGVMSLRMELTPQVLHFQFDYR